MNGKMILVDSPVFLDIETNSKHSHIWCCTIKHDGLTTTFTDPPGLVDVLDGRYVVAHNGVAFDFYVLEKVWGVVVPPEKQLDTLVLSRLHKPDLEGGHSLDAWGTRLGFAKGEYSEWDNPDMDALVKYNVRDVHLLEKVYNELKKNLENMKFSAKSVELEHQVASILSAQQRNGWMLDIPHSTTLLATLEDRFGVILQQLQARWPTQTIPRFHKKTGKPIKPEIIEFNPNSRQQVAEKLQEVGWKTDKKTPTGQLVVDESTLEGFEIPEVKLVLESLMLTKRISQLKSWLGAVGDDGRVHGYVNSIGAVSRRCTHSEPNMSQVAGVTVEYGKEMRQCWTVPEGKVLVGCDLSGIELRCLAHYMQDEEYTHELLNGDIHTKNQKAAGLETRAQAKTFIYAFLYGAGAAKIGSIVGGTAKDGEALQKNFLQTVPALNRLKGKVASFVKKGHLPTVDGGRAWIRSEHSALNTLLQSAGAIVSKQWLVCLHKNLKDAKIAFKQINYSHDEVELEVSPSDVDRVCEIAVASAREAGEVLGFRCPVDAEAKIGKNWYDVH